MNNFNRQFYTDLRIPNKVRDLWVQKKDEAGNPLAGAEFTLYSDADCTMPVAKGVTDAKGYISFSAENTGNNAATDPDGGLSSHVQYALALNRDATTDELSEKKLWLKETKPPKDYDCKDKKSTPGSDPKTGDLIVSKTFVGNKGDKNRDWSFVVKLDKNISGTYGEMTFTDGVSVFTLKHGESKTATALPVGMKYTVTEAEANQDEYTTSATGARGTIVENESVASFVNTKGDDKPSTPKGDLTISKTVLGTAGDKTKDWNFIVTLDDTSVNGIYGDMEFTIKECQINDIRRNLKSR
jgi:hypothetical protein